MLIYECEETFLIFINAENSYGALSCSKPMSFFHAEHKRWYFPEYG